MNYDDYYYEEIPQTIFESNQKSMMVFLVHSQSALQRSEQLRVLNSDTVPDLAAFMELGFPLKQTVKVHQTERQSGKDGGKGAGASVDTP